MKTETIIRENGYTAVWAKEPTGSKPRRQAIISESLKELRQIAAEHGGDVHFLRRRAGERTYEDKGVLRAANLKETTVPDYYTAVITVWEQAESDVETYLLKGFSSWGEYLHDRCPNADLQETIDVLKRLWVLGEQIIASVDQDEPTLIAVDEDNMQVVFATTADCTSYAFDVWEFQLGVIIPSEA
jgi:hypothetical protein